MKRTCHINIDGKPYSFEVEGNFFWGEKKLLYNEKDSVISKTEWANQGYSVVSAFTKGEFLILKQSITKNIKRAFDVNNICYNDDTFTLSKYHEVINTDVLHNKVINITRNLENTDLGLDVELLVEKFSKILDCKLTSWIEEIKKSHIQIRISRPNSLDINPLHRDSYLSYYRDILNIWIPIEGCNELSSLPIFPKSHLIPENHILRTESKGAKINGNTYYVPCILETNEGTIDMVRPNPKTGKALVFTPNLIHGAAINGNKDVTRISLELRFPKIK